MNIGTRGFLTDLFGGAKDMFRPINDFGAQIALGTMKEVDRGVNIAKNLVGQVDNFGTNVAKGAIREIDRGVKKAKEIAKRAKGEFVKFEN